MNDRVDQIFDATNREDFLTPGTRTDELDAPITIGHGQTNSQPSTVRAMLKWLDVQPGQTVLDVGSGSGWTTTLLAKLVGEDGRVIAVEIIPALLEVGRANCERAGVRNATFHHAEAEVGWSSQAPYDRILVSASVDEIPNELLEQLAPEGKLVIPVVNDILEITKDKDGIVYRIAHPGFTFVPLMGCAD